MATRSGAAYQLDLYTQEQHASPRYDFSVMEGGGRDSRARRDATPLSVTVARLAVAFVVMAALLGGLRVTLSVMTVECMSEVSATNSTISSARMARTELQAERSQLLAAHRIKGIATQNLNMSFATTYETITVDGEDLATASAEDAQLADDAEGDGTVA